MRSFIHTLTAHTIHAHTHTHDTLSHTIYTLTHDIHTTHEHTHKTGARTHTRTHTYIHRHAHTHTYIDTHTHRGRHIHTRHTQRHMLALVNKARIRDVREEDEGEVYPSGGEQRDLIGGQQNHTRVVHEAHQPQVVVLTVGTRGHLRRAQWQRCNEHSGRDA